MAPAALTSPMAGEACTRTINKNNDAAKNEKKDDKGDMTVAGSDKSIRPWRRNMVKLPSMAAMAVDDKDHTGERGNFALIKVCAKQKLSCPTEKEAPAKKVRPSAADLLAVRRYMLQKRKRDSQAKVQVQRDNEARRQIIKERLRHLEETRRRREVHTHFQTSIQ